MKDKFTNILLLIFTVSLIIFAPMLNYLKNNISNIALLNNKIFVNTLFILGCVLALTGLMLIITGLCYIRDSLLNKRGNIFKNMKRTNKVYIVIILIIIGIAFVPMIARSLQSSKDTTSTSQVNTQNDNSSTNTDQDNDSSTNTQQDNNTTSETNDNTSVNTSTQTETVQHPNTSGKLTSDDGNLELENDSSSDGKVLGTIKNLSSNSYSYVEVNINFYDNNGNQVDSTLTNMNNLEPNGTWKFSAPILDQDRSQRYRVVSIEGNR